MLIRLTSKFHLVGWKSCVIKTMLLDSCWTSIKTALHCPGTLISFNIRLIRHFQPLARPVWTIVVLEALIIVLFFVSSSRLSAFTPSGSQLDVSDVTLLDRCTFSEKTKEIILKKDILYAAVRSLILCFKLLLFVVLCFQFSCKRDSTKYFSCF